MSRKGGNRGLPAWWKGAKKFDWHDGSEIFQLDSTTVTQYGQLMHQKNFDSITEEQRQDMIKRRAR